MIKQFFCIGMIISFVYFQCLAMDKKDLPRYKQFTLLQPAPPPPSTPEDIQVDMRDTTPPRVILDAQEHIQILRQRNTSSFQPWDIRLRMLDDNSQEEETCREIMSRCKCIHARTCSCIKVCALVHCMQPHLMMLYLISLKTYFNQ